MEDGEKSMVGALSIGRVHPTDGGPVTGTHVRQGTDAGRGRKHTWAQVPVGAGAHLGGTDGHCLPVPALEGRSYSWFFCSQAGPPKKTKGCQEQLLPRITASSWEVTGCWNPPQGIGLAESQGLNLGKLYSCLYQVPAAWP